MRYFVTGATGYIGSRLVDLLLADGHQVAALVRDTARATALAQRGVDLYQGDLGSIEALRAGMNGVDGVFHVAGWYRIGARDVGAAWATNVEGTRNVLDTVRALGIPRTVYTSTLSVFSDTHGRLVDEDYEPREPRERWLSVYDETKWRAHFEIAVPLQQRGLPLIIVQPGAVYGPHDASPLGRALHGAAEGRLAVVPARTAYCWGHIEDTARGHVLAMQRAAPGSTYIIAGPPHTLAHATRFAARLRGSRPPRLLVPPAPLRGLAALLGRLERLPGWPSLPDEMTAEYLRVAAGVTYLGSSARAQRDLGFTARSLAEGLTSLFGRQT